MLKPRTILLTLSAITLTSCAQSGMTTGLPTRGEVNPLGIHANATLSDGLSEQANALNANARGIVRASTVKGAILGAAVGCGVGVLVADASACVKTAAVGAVTGAVAGNINGKRDVARRVELASPNKLVVNLRRANKNLDSIQQDLPALLAQQDAEINNLTLALASNQITKGQHDTRMNAIRSERAALAEALSLTASQAKQASANLKTASANGHSGLDWHISATDQLARESISARASITLL